MTSERAVPRAARVLVREDRASYGEIWKNIIHGDYDHGSARLAPTQVAPYAQYARSNKYPHRCNIGGGDTRIEFAFDGQRMIASSKAGTRK